MRTNFDIVIKGNSIGGRQGWAYICNSMEVTVLNAEINANDSFGDGEWKEITPVKLHEFHRNTNVYYNGMLELEKGQYKIGGHGACLSSRFSYYDAIELAKASNYPLVMKDKIVAVVENMKDAELVIIKLFKIGRIDPFCMTMTKLIPLTEEEMQEVRKKAIKWLNR